MEKQYKDKRGRTISICPNRRGRLRVTLAYDAPLYSTELNLTSHRARILGKALLREADKIDGFGFLE